MFVCFLLRKHTGLVSSPGNRSVSYSVSWAVIEMGGKMDAVGVARCQACRALLNVAWSTCAACRSPVPKRETQTALPVGCTGTDWLTAWRGLAAITDGITKDDLRFEPVLAALATCDQAFLANDWAEFQRAAASVQSLVRH